MIKTVTVAGLAGLGDRWESQVKAGFGRDANSYVPPTQDEFVQARDLVGGISHALHSGDRSGLEQLSSRAEQLGLQLSELKTPQESFVLLEDVHRGWGKVLFREQPTRPLTLEVPHPVFDGGTPELAMEIFADSGADALVMAGAHRWNLSDRAPGQPDRGMADPAHSPLTFFQAAHQGLVGHGESVLQVHGFKPRGPQDPQIYLSDGVDDSHDPPGLVRLHDSLQHAGLQPFIVDFKEDRLTARTNVQLADMAERGLLHDGEFLHMELNDGLRKGPDREKVRSAVKDWLDAAPLSGHRA